MEAERAEQEKELRVLQFRIVATCAVGLLGVIAIFGLSWWLFVGREQ